MLKVLNKITNMVFIMPDEKAIDTYKRDKETFEILDGGYIDEEPPREPTIAELIMKQAKKDKEEQEEVKYKDDKPKLKDMTREQLLALMKIYNIRGNRKLTKPQMIKRIEEYESKGIVE